MATIKVPTLVLRQTSTSLHGVTLLEDSIIHIHRCQNIKCRVCCLTSRNVDICALERMPTFLLCCLSCVSHIGRLRGLRDRNMAVQETRLSVRSSRYMKLQEVIACNISTSLEIRRRLNDNRRIYTSLQKCQLLLKIY